MRITVVFDNLERYLFLNKNFIPIRYEIFKEMRRNLFSFFENHGAKFLGYKMNTYTFHIKNFDKGTLERYLTKIFETMNICIPKVFYKNVTILPKIFNIRIGTRNCKVCDKAIEHEFICEKCNNYIRKYSSIGFISDVYKFGILLYKNVENISNVIHLKTDYESLILPKLKEFVEILKTNRKDLFIYVDGSILRLDDERFSNLLVMIYKDVKDYNLSRNCLTMLHSFLIKILDKMKHGNIFVRFPKSIKRFRYLYNFLSSSLSKYMISCDYNEEFQKTLFLLAKYLKIIYEEFYC